MPDGTTQSTDRTQFRLVQTPQTFRLAVIRQAFEQPESLHFTDDASVAEAAGNKIVLIDGDYSNLKITTSEDLHLVESHYLYNL